MLPNFDYIKTVLNGILLRFDRTTKEIKAVDEKIHTPDYAAEDGENGYIKNKPTLIGASGTGILSERFNHPDNVASGDYSHAEGFKTTASKYRSHAEGCFSVASGSDSHAEGNETTASSDCAHAEGKKTAAKSLYSHAEGNETTANGRASHAEGYKTIANALYSHAEGNETTAKGEASHAEGYKTIATGLQAHAEGNETVAYGDYSHAEGYKTYADVYGHAEGRETRAGNVGTHAEGGWTKAAHYYAHAEGSWTIASGIESHAEGHFTHATRKSQHTQGEYNILDTEGENGDVRGKYAHIVGNGTSETNRSNAHTLDWEGNAWFAGTVEGTALILKSSTTDSTKRFKITVDDSGTLTATEVTE